MAENRQIPGRRKKARMRRNAAHDTGVFVLYLALNHAMAKGTVVCRWRNRVLQRICGVERRAHHAKRTKNFALAKHIHRFVSKALENDAKNNEPNVAIFKTAARRGGQLSRESALEKILTVVGVLKQFFVARQAGTVREQHAQRDFLASAVIGNEFGDDGGGGSFEVEQAVLIEDHRHGSRGHNLS